MAMGIRIAPYKIGVSLMCPGLTATNAWNCALKRPDDFAESGFGDVDKAALETFGASFGLGMDPLEVGRKTVRGMTRNDGLILSHPEHGPDFTEVFEACMAALPDEPVPEGRAHIEKLRREANKAAAEGALIGLGDLT